MTDDAFPGPEPVTIMGPNGPETIPRPPGWTASKDRHLIIDPTDPDLPHHPRTAQTLREREVRRQIRQDVKRQGGPNEVRRHGQRFAVMDPEGMKTYLLIEGGKLWCDKILDGVKVRDRTCMRLYGETVRLVGGQQSVVNILIQQLGVRDESELQKLVKLGKKFQTMKDDASLSLEEYRDEAIALLQMLIREKPEWIHIVRHQFKLNELTP